MKIQNIGNNSQTNYHNNIKKQQSFGAIKVTMDSAAKNIMSYYKIDYKKILLKFLKDNKNRVFEYSTAGGKVINSNIALFLKGECGRNFDILHVTYQAMRNKKYTSKTHIYTKNPITQNHHPQSITDVLNITLENGIKRIRKAEMNERNNLGGKKS